MDYALYEPEDFAADESYLRYYFRLRREDVLFWQEWISRHPERLDVIISADHLISLMALQLPEDEFQQELERITQAIQEEDGTMVVPAHRRRSRKPLLWGMAAGIAAVFIAMVVIFFRADKASAPAATQLLAGNDARQIHTAQGPLKVQLEDGSIITLQEGARLSYPEHFTGQLREVQLEGEAFFEVGKDPGRPFYVYYNNLVTHALGTSFNIRYNPKQKQVEVAVRSGKVEVYERKTSNHGIILTPNQKVVYTEDKRQFEALVVEKPLPLIPDTLEAVADIAAPQESFVFNMAALPAVLKAFEKEYGIEIAVENEYINHCHFSGDISGMDFNARLEVICQALHTTYEIKGTKILIRGAGCK